ncbi:hypothetical protein [Halomarina rubra]|uniref:Uncharacterized protein n=1 Tax=Halomarina rubra TaxID=2071873 RepID=A0ABD6B038_9EURY|nr:hypothetical protein [Halomarina rubra]
MTLKESKVSESKVTRERSGKILVNLPDGKIEFDDGGNIRFTTRVPNASLEMVMKSYEEALSAIKRNISKSKQGYRVSMIIGDVDYSKQYLTYEENASEFGDKKLDTTELECTELNDFSVKFSFVLDESMAIV